MEEEIFFPETDNRPTALPEPEVSPTVFFSPGRLRVPSAVIALQGQLPLFAEDGEVEPVTALLTIDYAELSFKRDAGFFQEFPHDLLQGRDPEELADFVGVEQQLDSRVGEGDPSLEFVLNPAGELPDLPQVELPVGVPCPGMAFLPGEKVPPERTRDLFDRGVMGNRPTPGAAALSQVKGQVAGAAEESPAGGDAVPSFGENYLEVGKATDNPDQDTTLRGFFRVGLNLLIDSQQLTWPLNKQIKSALKAPILFKPETPLPNRLI